MNRIEWMIRFGDNLEGIMKDAGYDITTLSRVSGVSRSSLHEYIRGKREPSIVAINKLCAALCCDPNELLDLGYDIIE